MYFLNHITFKWVIIQMRYILNVTVQKYFFPRFPSIWFRTAIIDFPVSHYVTPITLQINLRRNLQCLSFLARQCQTSHLKTLCFGQKTLVILDKKNHSFVTAIRKTWHISLNVSKPISAQLTALEVTCEYNISYGSNTQLKLTLHLLCMSVFALYMS